MTNKHRLLTNRPLFPVSTSFSGFSDKHFLQVVRSKRHISNSLSYIETEKNCHCKWALVSATKHRSNDLSLDSEPCFPHNLSPFNHNFQICNFTYSKALKEKARRQKNFPTPIFFFCFPYTSETFTSWSFSEPFLVYNASHHLEKHWQKKESITVFKTLLFKNII